jgi:hypothetical protein
MHGMGFKAGVLGLSMVLGCTPAQRRAVGGAFAGVGLATSSVGVILLDPCLLERREDRELRRANEPSCRERTKPRLADEGTRALVTGVSVMALGGLLYLSGSDLRRPRPRPWRFKSPSSEPSLP